MSEKDLIDSIEIRKAEIGDAEGIVKLYNEVYGGNYSLIDLLDVENVKNLIKKEDYFWFIASLNEKTIASSAAEKQKWNNSAEYGRGAVYEEFRKNHLSTLILNKIKKEVDASSFDLTWSQIRNLPIKKICLNNLNQKLIGYLPGANLIKEREVHLLAMELKPLAYKKRVVSKIKTYYELPYIKKIISELNLDKSNEGEYPSSILVSPVKKQQQFLSLSFNLREKSLSLDNFDSKDYFKPEYLQTVVLIDKVNTIESLQNIGFSITGFFPAWFQLNEKRYDCVLMSLPLLNPIYPDKALESIIDEMKRGFNI